MKSILIKTSNIFRPWFFVDSRALGIYRILLGILCFIDIYRRYDLIDAFYTKSGIISISTSSAAFTLLKTFTKSWEVHLFFIVGLISSIMLIVGYRTKLFQIFSTIIIISIHNRAIMLENAGDFVVNSLLILSLFLPLGVSFSIDALKKSLQYKENNTDDLNNKIGKNIPSNIFSLAYFAILLQLVSIYFFTALNKSGYDWANGSAVYKMYQLDTFLTPIGYFLREYITYPVSKFLTYSTIYLEYSAVFLLFFPLYSHLLRAIFIFCFSIFHLSIRLSIKVGLFSFTMIITYVLLIDKKIFDKLKVIFKRKFHNSKYLLFYDSDCGFCFYTVRIIKRLDIYNQITFADSSYNGDTPKNYKELLKQSAILFDPENNNEWIKHKAFGKVLHILPFGFIFSWIFFVPIIEKLFGYIYDLIALNRTQISKFFGLAACNIKEKKENIKIENTTPIQYQNVLKLVSTTLASIIVLTLIITNMRYNLVANESVNDHMEELGYDKFRHDRTLRQISTYTRMIQRWNMFSPTVLGTDKTVIVEATLTNGDVINLFNGKQPVLDNLDYKYLWHDHNQFWRKFFSRVTKKQNSKYISSFEKWIKSYNNNYFDHVLNGRKIKSIKIWSLSQRNKNINSTKENKISKKLLNQKNTKRSTPSKRTPSSKKS